MTENIDQNNHAEQETLITVPSRKDELLGALALRLEAFLKMENTRIYQNRRFGFLMVGIAAIALAGFALPKTGNVDKDLVQNAETKTATLDISRYDLAFDIAPSNLSEKTITIKSGDNLGPLLQENGVSGPEAYKVTQAFAKLYDPRKVRIGQSFSLHFNDGTLEHLTFKPGVEKTVFVDRAGEAFKAREVVAEFRYETLSIEAAITNSLYVDATGLGAPDKVVAQFANIYEYSVDFQRDIQPGDKFEMFFEVARDHKGEIIKAGDLLYTSFSPRGKVSTYYLFKDSKGRENFYDEKGKTAKRKLRATPINGARLSSSFGKRRHPILGYRKMHSGVDFAAPTGTPVLAAGSGTVERANRYGGYGNYLLIRHSDGYKTAYAHLKGFARGIKKGAHVKQDQVVAYVGSTGRSTGPHLHYEVHHHGKKINPRRLSQLSGKPLKKSEIPAFKARQAEIDQMRKTSETVTQNLASAAMADAAPR